MPAEGRPWPSDDDGDDEEDEDGKDENYVCWESLKPPRLLHSKVLIGPLSPTQRDGDDDHLKIGNIILKIIFETEWILQYPIVETYLMWR